ncbi:MAG: glycosyltransferase family 2 protein [Verrucomicrobiota bacterium]
MREAPVVFIIFNRVECTRQVWARICEARPRTLLLIADGPRRDRSADAERCAEVRRLVETVDWPCDVRRNYAETNVGAARRIASGLDWAFALVEEAIILEDDCLPDPTFFPFCAELLERYRDHAGIAQIAGCSFQPQPAREFPCYFFSRYTHGWGWATWRRAWRLYDHEMKVWRTEREGKWLSAMIAHPDERAVWARCFDETLTGQVDAWDYRWTLAVWRRGMQSILPYRNLISNIGFGADATHTRRASPWAALAVSAMPFPLVHPDSLACDAAADEVTSRLVFRPPSLATRVGRRLRALFR